MPSPDSIDLLSPFLVPPRDARHRLFHGRGKTLPGWEGLTVDRFPPVLVATLFDDYDPATLAALEQRLGEALPGLGCDTLVFQHRPRRPAAKSRGDEKEGCAAVSADDRRSAPWSSRKGTSLQ